MATGSATKLGEFVMDADGPQHKTAASQRDDSQRERRHRISITRRRQAKLKLLSSADSVGAVELRARPAARQNRSRHPDDGRRRRFGRAPQWPLQPALDEKRK
jgi:hypothetical protein